MTRRHYLSVTVFFTILMASSRVPSQSSVPSAAGCYRVQVGAWDRRLGEDAVLHAIPRAIVLDTAATASPNAGRLAPNIDYFERRPVRRSPEWSVEGKTLRLIWTNGFTPTIVTLKRTASGWKGTAEAKSDAVYSLWPWRRRPRASVELLAQPCL